MIHRVVCLSEVIVNRIRAPVPIEFKKVSLLVGPNGCGKSTLLRALFNGSDVQLEADEGKVLFNDFELDNPRIPRGHFESTDNVAKTIHKVGSRRVSHGEYVKSLLSLLKKESYSSTVILLDEPDLALDYDGILELKEVLLGLERCQVIASVHHPLLVLDVRFHRVEFELGYTERLRGIVHAL